MAREIYAATKDLPVISMHGHVEPEVFADGFAGERQVGVRRVHQ